MLWNETVIVNVPWLLRSQRPTAARQIEWETGIRSRAIYSFLGQYAYSRTAEQNPLPLLIWHIRFLINVIVSRMHFDVQAVRINESLQ